MRKKKFKILILILFLNLPLLLSFNTTPNIQYPSKYNIQEESPQVSLGNGWIPNGTAITTASKNQYSPQICSDGAGGAIITWDDFRRSGSNRDIYAQRIDSNGNVQWMANGTAICTASKIQVFPQICSDGAGGAIITWSDYRSTTNWDIYAQRINSYGNVQWTPNGTAISTASNHQKSPQICSDGAGGAIIAWQDERSGPNIHIYAQRIDSDGIVQWTPNGTAICTASDDRYDLQICSDEAGGAIITWEDERSGSEFDIYAQAIDPSGNIKWMPNGTAICTISNDQYLPQICSDGAGGAIITWNDFTSELHEDIYAQRINSSGNVQWMPNGTAICTASDDQYEPQICSDGAGGAVITWIDGRRVPNLDVYAQRINSNGNVQWMPNGTAICTASDFTWATKVCSDGTGGAIITWEDERIGTSVHIYVQRINSNGNIQWMRNGTAICTASDDRYEPQICSDGAGGAIITWYDNRKVTDADIYAQRINDKIIINSPEDKIYTAPMDGYYPATYGFENTKNKTIPKDWVFFTNDPSGTAESFVIDEVHGHSKVLELKHGGTFYQYTNILSPVINPVQTSGIVEWWAYYEDNGYNHGGAVYIDGGGVWGSSAIVGLKGDGSVFYYNGTTQNNVPGYNVDTWHHFRVEFDCATDKYDLTVDGNLIASKIDFHAELDYVNRLRIQSSNEFTCRMYYDAIGYSWDFNYEVGVNLNEGLLLSFDTYYPFPGMEYSLDGQNGVSILGNTAIPMPEDGPHTIQVFGNTFQSEIRHFTIDTKIPEIVIHSPRQDDIFGLVPPEYNISIIEANLVSIWYTLDDGTTNITITELNGDIDEDAWLAAPNGPVTIRFYVKDIVDNIIHKDVRIIKEEGLPLSIIILIVALSSGVIIGVAFIIWIRKKRKL